MEEEVVGGPPKVKAGVVEEAVGCGCGVEDEDEADA